MTLENTVRDKFLEIRSRLNDQFVERDDVVEGMLLALLSRQHLLLVGPPGTAKTLIAQRLASYCGLSFFRKQLNQFTTPDEVYGGIDIKALKEESVQRRKLDRMAADTQLLYTDEFFRASGAIQDTLLGLMEERVYDNGDETVQTPLMTLIATSNSFPDDASQAAIYDRFLYRFKVDYLGTSRQLELMLEAARTEVDTSAILCEEDVEEAQLAIQKMEFEPSATLAVKTLFQALIENEIRPSDRRYVKLMDAMAAHAYLRGADKVQSEDVMVAQYIMWEEPSQAGLVKSYARKSIDPVRARISEIMSGVRGEFSKLMNSNDSQIVLSGLTQFSQLKKEIMKIGSGSVDPIVQESIDEIDLKSDQIVSRGVV